mmetsp:Transcript_29448/g.62518  ORF Transcript_29448/g.62518 Transcript_29448/m.62518 type:complete len:162 (-) Transcript_29448:269-754(-)
MGSSTSPTLRRGRSGCRLPRRAATMARRWRSLSRVAGGNHGQFGTYNDSERSTLLSQNDGMATISAEGQQEQAAGAIAYVATFGDSSVGGQDKVSPARSPTQSSNTTAGNDTVLSPTRSPTQSPTTTSLSSAGFMASASASQNLFNAILAAAVAVWAAFAI